jgi:hypothetical protein
MKRDEFVKIAINDPKKAAKILRQTAKEFESCKGVTKTAAIIQKTLFVSERTVFNDCKK